MIPKTISELHVVGQRITAVRQSPAKTNLGRRVTVDQIELANGMKLIPRAYNCDQTGPVGDIETTAKPDDLPTPELREALAAGFSEGVAARWVDRMFAGRKGHGGGPCMSRVLRRDDLLVIIQAVYDAGMDAGRCMHPKP